MSETGFRGGSRLEEIERFLDLGAHLLTDRLENRGHTLRIRPLDLLPLLEELGLIEGDVEILLDRLGEEVAADRDIAPEDRGSRLPGWRCS